MRTNWMVGLMLSAALVATGISTTAAAGRCSISSTAGMSFGRYDPGSRRPLDATASVAIQCSEVSSGDVISIELSRSRSGGFVPRTMVGGRHGEHFEYNLYLDAARTLI